jgi:hypothetical protein
MIAFAERSLVTQPQAPVPLGVWWRAGDLHSCGDQGRPMLPPMVRRLSASLPRRWRAGWR